jgi:hypothetical protein
VFGWLYRVSTYISSILELVVFFLMTKVFTVVYYPVFSNFALLVLFKVSALCIIFYFWQSLERRAV